MKQYEKDAVKLVKEVKEKCNFKDIEFGLVTHKSTTDENFLKTEEEREMTDIYMMARWLRILKGNDIITAKQYEKFVDKLKNHAAKMGIFYH